MPLIYGYISVTLDSFDLQLDKIDRYDIIFETRNNTLHHAFHSSKE